MINRIINDTITTAAKRVSGKIGNVAGNGILITAAVGGSGHVEADFLAHTITANIRQAKGDDIPLLSGTRMLDLLKYSDFKGGFSADLEGDDGARYVAYVPIGRVKLEGDDVLDVEISLPGDATATYQYTVMLCDLASGPDSPLIYELITGTGAEQLVRDVYGLFLVSNGTGATISVKDEMGKTYNLIDNDVIDLANALGEMESYEEIGTLFSDPYDVSQDIRVKLPSGTYALALRGFFDADRYRTRTRSEGVDMGAMFAKIKNAKPAKALYLEMSGKGV